jgi:threonine dehydrogenase-like Zn-dependent dehydrogenase
LTAAQLDAIGRQITTIPKAITARLKEDELTPKEFSIQFGIGIEVEGGLPFVAKGTVETNFKITATTGHALLPADCKGVRRRILRPRNGIVTTLCPGGKERMRRLIEMERRGKLDLTPLITHRFKLADINAAYKLFGSRADGVMKVAITP